MKILLVNSSDPARWGGGEIWMRRTLKLLQEMGHEALGMAREGSPALSGEGGGRAWAGDGASLKKTLLDYRPDLAVALQHRDLRLIHFCRAAGGPRRIMARHLASARGSWKRRLYYRHLCDALWVPSQYMKDALSRLDGVAPEKLFVIRPSVPQLPARPEPLGAPTVLCVGRLSREKGQDVLLRARALMSQQARLLMVGSGPESARLRRLASKLDVAPHVEWVDFMESLDSAFERAHLAAQPSRLESFGLAALEAMSRGVAVVASRAGGLIEVVGEAGALVPPQDAKALAGVLDRGLSDRALRARWSAGAMHRARREFSPEREREAFQAAIRGSLA